MNHHLLKALIKAYNNGEEGVEYPLADFLMEEGLDSITYLVVEGDLGGWELNPSDHCDLFHGPYFPHEEDEARSKYREIIAEYGERVRDCRIETIVLPLEKLLAPKTSNPDRPDADEIPF